MDIHPLSLDGLLLVKPRRFGDERGFFSEVFRQDLFEAVAGPVSFVQDNHSFSAPKGTLRGLHYQSNPAAQGKLVRVTRGVVLDVVVDVRAGSKTYGQHVKVELSAENWQQLWIPPGFLHGFCTLTENVEFLYKVTHVYSAAHDGSVAFNDPDIGITWPFPDSELILSPKDAKAKRLRDLAPIF